jgi:eukaryotic-like serine/threonine-protein kinase
MRTQLVLTTLVLALSVVAVRAQSGTELLQQASARRDQGKIQEAVQIYERIVRDFPSNRPLKAQALMQVAECYRLLGQAKERAIYEQIIKEFERFPDQAMVVKTARSRLAALKHPPSWASDDGLLVAEFKNTTGNPTFDGLNGALMIRLDQSPYLNLLSLTRIREALARLGKPEGERVTHAVAREICTRAGARGILLPSISLSANRQYVLSLDVQECRSGDTFERVQVTATDADQVRFGELKNAASDLRAKLGESPESIKRFDNDLALLTTSFEALEAFREGYKLYKAGEFVIAADVLSRAISHDPNFASAHYLLSRERATTGQASSARESAMKAHALRMFASEKEKLNITATYELFVTGDWEEATATLKQLRELYPRDADVRLLLGNQYRVKGLFRDGLVELQEALRLDPTSAPIRESLMRNYIELDRRVDVRALWDDTVARQLDYTSTHRAMYEMSYLGGDADAMRQQLEWLTGAIGTGTGSRAGQGVLAAGILRAYLSAAAGKMSTARPLFENLQSFSFGRVSVGANVYANETLHEALFGNMTRVRERAELALNTDRRYTLARIAVARALAGHAEEAAVLIEESRKELPADSMVNAVWIPTARAARELRHGNGVGAIELLKPATEWEPSANSLWAIYVRGLAYLQMKAGREAAAEFQKILDHRRVAPLSPLYPASKMRIAEAYALMRDVGKAKAAYQEFFTLWKDADPDVPMLMEARAKFAALPNN